MSRHSLIAFACVISLAAFAAHRAQAEDERTVRVQFKPGADSAEITDRIEGREFVAYKLNAREGQFLSVSMKTDNESADFNIYIPGRGPGDEALFGSSLGGREYVGQLYKSGDHTITVFLNRNAARKGEEAKFDIVFRVTAEPPAKGEAASADAPATREATYGGIRFTVATSEGDEGKRFTITPSGLSVSNDPITTRFEGTVVDVKADDIDGDNSPEVAVITESGSEKRRKAHVFTTFGGKSFGMVNYPELTDAKLLGGYRGGDEYEFVENTFIRRFPLHGEDGAESGETRQLQYKLHPGEAMKQLVLDRSVEY